MIIKIRHIKYNFLLILLLFSFALKGQDIQYSQYYANALYLSPAFAGADQSTRAIAATRYHWPGLDASFLSYTASIDHYVPSIKSGLGVIVTSDQAIAANLRSTDIGFIYSYQADLSEKLVFKPAIQLSYVTRSVDFHKLTFGTQYNDNGFIGGSTGQDLSSSNVSYADISAGALFYSDSYWFGLSTHHLNQPNQSFLEGESPLSVKTSFFGGVKISLTDEVKKRYFNPNEEKSLSPTFLYKMQGKSDQLDIGLYGRYNALVLGLWYRGLPVKVYKPEGSNNDALVFLIGMFYKNFNIGYSFDCTISKLTMNTIGSHELTLSYSLKRKKKSSIQKRPVCPKF